MRIVASLQFELLHDTMITHEDCRDKATILQPSDYCFIPIQSSLLGWKLIPSVLTDLVEDLGSLH